MSFSRRLNETNVKRTKPVIRHQERVVPAVISANGGRGELHAGQSAAESRETGGRLSTTVTDVVVNFAGVELPLDPEPSA